MTTYASYFYDVPEQVSDPAGRVTTVTLDQNTLATLSTTRDPNGLKITTSQTYDTVGNVATMTDGDGDTTTMAHDATRQPTDVTPPSPFQTNTTHYDYDLDGRIADQKRADGNGGFQTVSRTYAPARNLLNNTTDASGNTTSYAYFEGYPFYTADPLGRLNPMRRGFNGFGWATQMCHGALNQQGLVGQTSVIYQQTYTPNGLPYKRTGHGNTTNVTTTSYDGFDRVGSVSYGGGGSSERWTYAPNSDDLATHLTRAGNTVTFVHDALHRLEDKDAGNNSDYAFYIYDRTGRVIQASNQNGDWSYSYDTAGRPARDTLPNGRTITYGFDAAGNLTSELYPSGDTIEYTYDALNREQNALWAGHQELWEDPRDALDRPTKRIFRAPSPSFETDYAYPNDDVLPSAVTQVTGLNGSGRKITFSDTYAYNKARQVTSETRAGSGIAFTPTHPSNATTSQIQNSAPNDLDQATSEDGAAGGNTLTYDGNGNQANGPRLGYTLTWDLLGEGRLLTARANAQGGVPYSYTYDPFGRRIGKNGNSGQLVTNYALDRFGHEIVETDGNGNTLVLNVYPIGGTTPAAVITGSGDISFHLLDAHGSLVQTVRDGVASAPGDYLPYGESSNRPPASFGYAGYRFDAETGLYHTARRYYDPRAGRFISPDPIGYQGGNSLYAYAGGDPVNNVDPSGMDFGDYQTEVGGGGDDGGGGGGDIYVNGSGGGAGFADLTIGGGGDPVLQDITVTGHAPAHGGNGAIPRLGTTVTLYPGGPTSEDAMLHVTDSEGAKVIDCPSGGQCNQDIVVTGRRPGPDLLTQSLAGFFLTAGPLAVIGGPEEEALIPVIRLSISRFGPAAEHAADAQAAGHPSILTINRIGTDANRAAATANIERVPGLQLDEYPPAMFQEGGAGASVRAIDPSSNMSAGAYIGNCCRLLPNGSQVQIEVVP